MTDWEIICGDCLDVMRGMADNSVDAVITSPPYNIGKAYSTTGDNRTAYIYWLEQSFSEIARLTNDCAWVNLGYRKTDRGNVPIAFEVWDKMPLYLVQAIKWEYGAGMTYRRRFNHRSEDWLWFAKDGEAYTFNPDNTRDPSLTKYKNDKRNNPNGKLPSDIWYFPHIASNFPERCNHPAQYPVAMIERILKACVPSGGLVLDPFMGSGTTGVACQQLGRRFIGIEISPEYCEIARQRLSTVQLGMAI